MKEAVLFDLGGTLAEYFDLNDFPDILRETILRVQEFLLENGVIDVPPRDLWRRVEAEEF
jgi:hypothetical protein